MPSVKDITIETPSEEEKDTCSSWPVWQCEKSTFDWVYTQTETCLLLAGKVTVSDSEGAVTFGAGDLVTLPEGLECTWQVSEPVKKHYSFS